MQEKEITVEKYIRKDDPGLNASVEYINYLVDAFKQTGDIVYRDALLDSFHAYFRKYVSIMTGRGNGVDVNNSDTKSFLRLFMKKEDRMNNKVYLGKVGSYIHMIRRALLRFEPEDIHHDLIVSFLELLEKYETVTYNRNEENHRISFAHYVQVNIRYKLCKWVIKKSQDVVTGQVCLEFKDEICADEPNYDNDPLGVGIGIDLKDWVWGDTATAPFSELSEMERYLLWLRYECDPNGKKISTREMALTTGYHERSIIYKLKKIKAKLGRSHDLS